MKSRSIEPVELLRAGTTLPGNRALAATDLRGFLNVHAVSMVAATAVAFGLVSALPVAVTAATTFGWLASRRVVETQREDVRFGWGNGLTFLRAFILLGTASAFGRLAPVAVFALLTVNVLLDAVDGFVARQFDECSDFGATCDAEVDALYVMVAGLFFYMSAGWGAWVLIPGLLRYVHRLVAWGVAGPAFVERPRRYARTMAGVVFVLLLGAILLPPEWQLRALVLATITSSLSFSFSFIDLARHGGERPSV